MVCKCGGILDVIRIEEPSKSLEKPQQLIYNRICDVQCVKCGEIYYSQPYDSGMRSLNKVRKIEKE